MRGAQLEVNIMTKLAEGAACANGLVATQNLSMKHCHGRRASLVPRSFWECLKPEPENARL